MRRGKIQTGINTIWDERVRVAKSARREVIIECREFDTECSRREGRKRRKKKGSRERGEKCSRVG